MSEIYEAYPALISVGMFLLLFLLALGIWAVCNFRTLREKFAGRREFTYDSRQNIFCFTEDAWQGEFGYCRLYDEAAAPASMIIDCEPVSFDWDGKRWLIEFWKGQYGMACGAEVGVYNTTEPEISIPEVFTGQFYQKPEPEEYLKISMTLVQGAKVVYRRESRTWWLTGFIPGRFAWPRDLQLVVIIEFPHPGMAHAFATALQQAGYQGQQYVPRGAQVMVIFSKPHTEQPLTRTEETDRLTQEKNRLFCEVFQRLTAEVDDVSDSLELLRRKYPEYYRLMTDSLRPQGLYEAFRAIGKTTER